MGRTGCATKTAFAARSHKNMNLISSFFLHIVVLLSLIQLTSAFHFLEWGPDLEGPWCAKRPQGEQCCVGRDDDCMVPILGTECYCDIFCNDTSFDCCPDYWGHCHGLVTTTRSPTTLPPPRTTRIPIGFCIRGGRRYDQGEAVTENCNVCTCEKMPGGFNTDWRCTDDPCLIRPEIIEEINDGSYTWKAQNYPKLWGLTLNEGMRYRLGTFPLEANVLKMTPISAVDDVLPESFDARVKWPNLISAVRDQGNCASSWAHSTIAVAEDRLRIESNGVMSETLSVQHLVSCDTDGQDGCKGGHLDRAWWYMRKIGVVSEQCYPYSSGQTDEKGECFIPQRKKKVTCPSGTAKTKERYKSTPPYRIRPVEREIMKEILLNGPVQATYFVREDFFMYSRGIYSYSSIALRRGDPETYLKSGFHSGRIVGWGAERNGNGDIVKYWTCANSWGSDWGEDGYFRIVRGTDESQIERAVVGVWGKVSGDSTLKDILTLSRRQRWQTSRGGRQFRHLGTRRRNRRRELRLQQRLKEQLEMSPEKFQRRQERRNRRKQEKLLKKKHKKNKKSKKGKKKKNANHEKKQKKEFDVAEIIKMW